MAKKKNKLCPNCIDIIDSISLELKSVDLIEDSLSRLANEAIKSTHGTVTLDKYCMETISTALYNSLNHIKNIIFDGKIE